MQDCSITPAHHAGGGHGIIEPVSCVLGEEKLGWGWRELWMTSPPMAFSSWNTWTLMEILNRFRMQRKMLISSGSKELRWGADEEGPLISNSWKASQRKSKIPYRGSQKQLWRQELWQRREISPALTYHSHRTPFSHRSIKEMQRKRKEGGKKAHVPCWIVPEASALGCVTRYQPPLLPFYSLPVSSYWPKLLPAISCYFYCNSVRRQDCHCAVCWGAACGQRAFGTMVAKRLSAPISQTLLTVHVQAKNLEKDKKLSPGIPVMMLLHFCSSSQGKPLCSLFSHVNITPSRNL